MNTLVVYASQFGNTERIARVIAHTMRSFGEAHAARVEPYHIFKIEGLDLLIVFLIPVFVGGCGSILPRRIWINIFEQWGSRRWLRRRVSS